MKITCDGSNVLKCIFDSIAVGQNGLISMVNFTSFVIKEARWPPDHVNIREEFRSIDTDGSGGLDFLEFKEFFSRYIGVSDGRMDNRDPRMSEENPHRDDYIRFRNTMRAYYEHQVAEHLKAIDELGRTGTEVVRIVCPTNSVVDGNSLLRQERVAIAYLLGNIDPDARAVLDFWFPASLTEAMMLWFGKSPALDEQIRRKFGSLVDSAAKGHLDGWTDDPCECLALIILLDQFPRNMFRHQKQMYATDVKAQAVVMKALFHNYHRIVSPLQGIFMPCLVLTHSEQFHHQELCVDIWCHMVQNELPKDDQLRIFGMIFLNHLKVVAKFGRFPHRNEILERTSTEVEEAFLNDKSFRFDLPLHYSSDGKVVFEETTDFVASKEGEKPPEAERIIEDWDVVKDACYRWKNDLEKQLGVETNDAIKERSGKKVAVEYGDHESVVGDREYPSLHIGKAEAAPTPLQSWKANRESRKNMMAKTLAPSVDNDDK